MSTSITDTLIARSVSIPGYLNPVIYDPNHMDLVGYWICKECKSNFFGGGKALHEPECSIKGYRNANMLCVLGPKSSTLYTPFKKEEIEKIKEIAKAKLTGC